MEAGTPWTDLGDILYWEEFVEQYDQKIYTLLKSEKISNLYEDLSIFTITW